MTLAHGEGGFLFLGNLSIVEVNFARYKLLGWDCAWSIFITIIIFTSRVLRNMIASSVRGVYPTKDRLTCFEHLFIYLHESHTRDRKEGLGHFLCLWSMQILLLISPENHQKWNLKILFETDFMHFWVWLNPLPAKQPTNATNKPGVPTT